MIDHELIAIWKTCKMPNWDDYGAFPVSAKTLKVARAFVQTLPSALLPCSIGAEPDGHLTLDWDQHPRCTFSVSVSPEGILHYAGLFGDLDPRGRELFLGDIPKTVLDLIEIAATPLQISC